MPGLTVLINVVVKTTKTTDNMLNVSEISHVMASPEIVRTEAYKYNTPKCFIVKEFDKADAPVHALSVLLG